MSDIVSAAGQTEPPSPSMDYVRALDEVDELVAAEAVEPEVALDRALVLLRLITALLEKAAQQRPTPAQPGRALQTASAIESYLDALWFDDEGPVVAREIAQAYLNGDRERVDAHLQARQRRRSASQATDG
jgi:hypothetical protein